MVLFPWSLVFEMGYLVMVSERIYLLRSLILIGGVGISDLPAMTLVKASAVGRLA